MSIVCFNGTAYTRSFNMLVAMAQAEEKKVDANASSNFIDR